MFRYSLVCLLLAGLAWGQATAPATGPRKTKPAQSTAKADAGDVAPNAAVITITGLCEKTAAGKTKADCKTIITRTEFEKIVHALQPDMPDAAKRQFAERYVSALILAGRAHERGLDQGPTFTEMMKLMRVQVLAQDLVNDEKDRASHISDAEVQSYYQSNNGAFEEATLDRLVIPRMKKPAASDGKSAPKPEDSEAAMKKEADDLHARAVAGEDFGKLQAEALQMAGYDIKPPQTKLEKVRRKSLPAEQFRVFDLKAGAVSDLIPSEQAYFVYKMEAKNIMPLAEVRDEIRSGLEDQHLQDAMNALEHSAQPSFDQSYFKAPAESAPGAHLMPPASTHAATENAKR